MLQDCITNYHSKIKSVFISFQRKWTGFHNIVYITFLKPMIEPLKERMSGTCEIHIRGGQTSEQGKAWLHST